MTNDGDRPGKVTKIPELVDVMESKSAPRFIQHEGRIYDLSLKFDQNCVKMHMQRLSRHRRSTPEIKPRSKIKLNRHQRRRAKAMGDVK